MEEDNKEKELDGLEPEKIDSPENGENNKDTSNLGDDWKWDVATPETYVDDISADNVSLDVKKAKPADEEKQEDTQESEDEGLCIVCGKPRHDSPSDLYCESCRSKFLKTNYGAGHIILAFVMAILVVISYCVCVPTAQIAADTLEAESKLSQNLYNETGKKYSDITKTVTDVNSVLNTLFKGISTNFLEQKWFDEGLRANNVELSAMVKTLTIMDYADFIQATDTILTKAQLESGKYDNIKAAYNFCQDLQKVAEEISPQWQAYMQGDGTDENYIIPYDEIIKYLDSYKAQTDAQKSYIEFYKALTAYNAEKGNDVTLKFFENAYKLAGDFSYTYNSTYMALAYEIKNYDRLLEVCNIAAENNPGDTSAYNFAAKAYIIKGDFEKATEMCEKIKENNAEDIMNYSCIKAEILRRQSKFEQAIQVCDEAIDAGNQFSELFRQKAIACILAGKKDEALEASKQVYDISLQNAYAGETGTLLIDMNTAALIASLCNSQEDYQKAIDILDQVQVSINEEVQNCIDGKLNVEDIFMKGIGDIQ